MANSTAKRQRPPTRFRAITVSDSTDVTDVANRGLWVSVTGAVVVMGVGDTAAAALGTVPAGTFIPGAFQRVMAATAATVIGLSADDGV